MAKHPTQHAFSTTAQEHETVAAEANAAVAEAVAAAQTPATTTIKIGDIDVTVPLRFAAGHVLTGNQAAILDAAYQRQFYNNQNAMAKARAEAYAKATTEAERNAKAPLTADELAALYTVYEPNVGAARGSNVERLRTTAAWAVWTDTVVAHNKSVAAGGDPVIAKAAGSTVTLLVAPRKSKGTSDTAHAAAVEAYEAAKAGIVKAVLASPAYAERVQVKLDALMAEKPKAAPADASAIVAGVDLI